MTPEGVNRARGGLTLRPVVEADLPALSALYEIGFDRPLTSEEWRWKYRQIPGEALALVAAADDGEIFAHAGALGLPVRWRGEERIGWQMVDFVGKPRGMRPPLVSLGHAIYEQIPRRGDLPWCFGFPSERHLELGVRLFSYGSPPAPEIWSGELPAEGSRARVEFVSGDAAGPWAEAAWERCGVDGLRRSVAFLNWRYYARPERYYRFYRLRSGALDGLVVAAFVAEEALLAELWLPPGGEWEPLLRAVGADLRATGLLRWRAWEPHGQPALLSRLGMAPTGVCVPRACRGETGRGRECEPMADEIVHAWGDHDFV